MKSFQKNWCRYGKSIILVANKVDSEEDEVLSQEFSRLGLGPALSISAEHGRGIGILREHFPEALGPKPEAETGTKGKRIQISLVGRPEWANHLLEMPD